MIIDPSTYAKSVNNSIHNESKKTVMDYALNSPKKAAGNGAVLAPSQAGQVSESGAIRVDDAFYSKPNGKEKDPLEELMEDSTKSEELHKNEMAVIAQSTSPEDYARVSEEGFSVLDSDTHTVVTVLDKIKAVLAKSGDTSMGELSKEQLEEITGSAAMAAQISNLMDDAKAYLLKNELEPTVSNLYKAVYSGSNMAKVSISESDFEEISTQIEDLLKKANINVDNSALENAKWLLTYQIPVTEENLKYLETLQAFDRSLQTGEITPEMLTDRIKEAVLHGYAPEDAILPEGASVEERAEDILRQLEGIEDYALENCIQEGKEITLSNLLHASRPKAGVTVDEAKLANARRQLEEVRLLMTVEANRSLLKKGIQIDTEPMEKLIGELKEIEDTYYHNLLESEGVDNTKENVTIFRTSVEYVRDLKEMPCVILDKLTLSDTLTEFHRRGQAVRTKFEAAQERYEILMTSPRKDMGDSYGKAFRNVDAILEDYGLETSESNRRAVRILAYNNTELTPENIERVKEVDTTVQKAFASLTPKVTLEMIRQGKNPLQMSMSELENTAEQIKENLGTEDVEKFSKFLYNLEQRKDITTEERESYIGIYRLIAQVEKSDGAAIGALMNQGAEITMKNLLSAIRSEKKTGMEYNISDAFQGVDSVVKGKAIDTQILSAFDKQYEEMQLQQLKEAAKAPEEVYKFLEKIDEPVSATNILATTRMLEDSNQMLRRLFRETPSNKEKIEDLKEIVLERFGEAVKNPTALAEAQEVLADVAENTMKQMIVEDPDVQSIDVREMKLVTAGLRICAKEAREESFLVPIETSEGICGVAVRIIRDEDKKGTVDITFRGDYSGKLAAGFEAKEDRISGIIAVSNEETRTLISEQLGLLANSMEEAFDVKVVLSEDLSLEKYRLHSMEKNPSDKANVNNTVQTKRLYHIAEKFIEAMQEWM